MAGALAHCLWAPERCKESAKGGPHGGRLAWACMAIGCLAGDGDAVVPDEGRGGAAASPREEGSQVWQSGWRRRPNGGARHPVGRIEAGHRPGLCSDRVVGRWNNRCGAEGRVRRAVERPREASPAAALRRRTGNLPPVPSERVGRSHVRGGGRRRSKGAALDYPHLGGKRVHEEPRHVDGGEGVAEQHRRGQIAARRWRAHVVGEGASASATGVIVPPGGAAFADPAPPVAVRGAGYGRWDSVATGLRVRLRSSAGAAQVRPVDLRDEEVLRVHHKLGLGPSVQGCALTAENNVLGIETVGHSGGAHNEVACLRDAIRLFRVT